MKGFQKFVKQSWNFYLTALIIVLFLVICDSVYICREEGVAFTGKSIEQQVKSELAQDKGAGNIRETLLEGNKLCGAIEDKADSASVMGYYITILGIMVLLAWKKPLRVPSSATTKIVMASTFNGIAIPVKLL